MKTQVNKYCLLLIVTVLFISNSFAQTDTLFWFGFPYGSSSHTTQDANITITATDLDDSTQIMITQPYVPNPANPATYIDTIYITIDPTDLPLKLTWDTLLAPVSLLKVMNNNYVQSPIDPSPYISNSAIKIQSDRKITAYYEYNRTRNNPDIFSMKGTNALGTDFWIPFQEEWRNQTLADASFSQIIVVATEPNTVIDVTFQKDAFGMPASPIPYTFTLAEPGQTLMFAPKDIGGNPSVNPGDHLYGTHITSNEPIAITTGDCSVVKGGWDMVGDQIVPIQNMFGKATIGYEYIVMKGELDNTNGNEKVYVLTTTPNTTVDYQIKGAGLVNLMTNAPAGFQDEINLVDGAPADEYVYIVADEPIYVWHVSGFGREVGGAVIPTIDGCTGSLDVSFVRSKNQDFYLNIMAHDGSLNDFEISFNGGAFIPFLDATKFEFSGYGDFWVLKDGSSLQNGFPVGEPIRIKNTTNVFHLGTLNGVQVGGGCAYGYFSDYIQNDAAVNIVASGSDIITACYGEEVELEASGGFAYLWSSSSGSDVYLDDITSDQPSAFLPIGIHQFSVNILGPCGLNADLPVSVQINENTESYFTLDEYIGCAPLTVELNNLTLFADTFLIDWEDDRNYDFFADTNIIKTIPPHSYYNKTDHDSLYTIKLFAYDKKKDCPDIYTKKIRVFPEINAGFDVDTTQGCNALTVNLTDTSSRYTMDSYKWDFGDGESIIDTLIPVDVSHEFRHFQNDTVKFDVKLIATSPYFCRDTASTAISVYSYLESEFTIDTAYGCSPFNVSFTNISSGQDSVSLIFGDGDIFNAADFGIESHTFENTGDTIARFPVELQTFNIEGCSKIWRDTIVVYPEFEAKYTIDNNSYEGCNIREVIFTNTTTISPEAASIFLWTFGDGTNSPLASPTHTYNNTFSSDHDYAFTLKAESVHGCSDDTSDVISIYRAEAHFTVDADEDCSPFEVTVFNSSVGDIAEITDWNWDYGDGGSDNIKNPLLPHKYYNTGFENDTNKILLEVIGTGGCTSKDSIDIIVYPQIKANYTPAYTTVPSCDSLVVVFNSNIVNPLLPTVSYVWTFGDGGSSSVSSPTHTYKNLASAIPVPNTVNLHVETDLGCVYDTISSITVNPLVNAKIFIDKKKGCSPLTVDVDAQNYIGISSYSWDYGDGFGFEFVIDPLQYIYPTNTTYLAQPAGDESYTLTLNVEDGTGACTDSETVDIKVYSEIAADFTPKNVTGCNPYTVNFTDQSSPNVESWQWDFKDGATSSSQNISHEFENLNPSGDGLFNVKLNVISDGGCEDSTVSLVTVRPYIKADFDIEISEGCSPLEVKITNNSLGSGTEWYWYWDKDDYLVDAGVIAAADSANSFASFTKFYTNKSGASRIDSLTLIVGNGNGCYEIFKRAITVHTEITAQFTVNPVSQEGCNPLNVDFTNTNILAGGTYTWTFGDGSSSPIASPSHEFINTKTDDETFTVRLEAESSDGCFDSEETDIIVYSKVISGFSIENSEGCPPFTTSINNTSVGNVGGDTYQWLIDNVPVAGAPINKADFDHTYENLINTIRNYEVKLIATNPHGCTSEHTDIVEVYEFIEASFSMDKNNGCAPLEVTFTDLSYVPAETVYSWAYGDGSSSGTTTTHTHLFYNASRENDLTRTIDLTLQSSNYCSDDTSLTVNVFHEPLADFFIDNTSSCPPLESTLSSLAEGEDSFEWRFGDGNTNTVDKNLAYSWPNTLIDVVQPYKLLFWVGTINNCKDSLDVDLSVFPDVIADFSIDNDADCSPLLSNFTNQSTTPATQFFWSFGDGTTTNLENPGHDFANIGSTDKVYDIYFRASSEYNCWDTITKQVTSYVQPNAEFYMAPKLLVFPNNIVSLTNLTNFGPFGYDWSFGDLNNSSSSVDQPNAFEYEHWGEKIISLEVNSTSSGNCNDIYIDTLLIMPPLVNADFTMDIEATCLNDNEEITFTAFPVIVYGDEYEYEWDFGDETEIETGKVVYHTFNSAGLYFVKLVARSTEIGREDEEDFVYKSVRVYANPVANMEVSPKISMLNSDLLARVEFFNLSECSDTSGCSYLWDFGDGGTAISKDVTHNYTEIGVYDVSLLVTTASGCKDSILLEDEVSIIGEGDIKFPNAFTPNGDGLNDSFKPVYKGVIPNTYAMYVYNRWGELIFTTKDLDAGWNGKMNGDFAKPDVYVWKAEGKFTNGRSFELAGDITLIR